MKIAHGEMCESIARNDRYDAACLRHACWDMEARISELEEKMKKMELEVYGKTKE